MKTKDIAPCGMNCALCMAFQRDKRKCNGCFGDDKDKPNHCVNCTIKLCDKKEANSLCGDCGCFPCTRLKQLDKRYKTKYNMSMLENISYIKEYGMDKFLNSQKDKYTCKACEELVSVHRPNCLKCGADK